MNYCEMILVDGADNHNKVYIMEQISEDQFRASWGRYGAALSTKLYSMNVWDKIQSQKLGKGYADITKMKTVITQSVGVYAPIADKAINDLITRILAYANECIRKNYRIRKQDVTKEMIVSARESIHDLVRLTTKDCSVKEFNHVLEKLFCIIPRRMSNVADYLATSEADYGKIIERETSLINVMSSMAGADDEDVPNSGKTILDAFGLTIRPCDEKENRKVKEKLTAESAGKFACAFRISNKKCDDRFNEYVKKNRIQKRDMHFFWHGTRNANVWGVLKKGMLLNPNAIITAKMFGYGFYFATRAKKSIKYTSLDGYYTGETADEGFLFVMKVAYKNPKVVYSWESWMSNLKGDDIRKAGNDAVFASKERGMLINDEIIVYDEAQVCPRYLVVLKKSVLGKG